ncbi:MAG TPA: NADPH-dependent F420 reductase [Gaiellaceae bacterium]|nr:NADPH-dependent F420 reductase [Gaiellaceae bacterium]
MEISIIGTGNMARGIGTRALDGGHDVTFYGTTRENAQGLAGELSRSAKAAAVGDPLEGDVVVLALWYPVTREVVERYGDALDGKVVVDISNPVNTETFERIVPDAGSGAQEVAAAAPGARVVKAFNTTFAGTVMAGEVSGQPLDVLIASDDDEAKKTVASVAEDGGLRAVDAGPLERARELEAAGYLHMVVQEGLGTGYGSALRIVA